MYTEQQIEAAVNEIRVALKKAIRKHPTPFASPHEGFDIIDEEHDELKVEIRKQHDQRDFAAMRKEAAHAGAMNARFILDITQSQTAPDIISDAALRQVRSMTGTYDQQMRDDLLIADRACVNMTNEIDSLIEQLQQEQSKSGALAKAFVRADDDRIQLQAQVRQARANVDHERELRVADRSDAAQERARLNERISELESSEKELFDLRATIRALFPDEPDTTSIHALLRRVARQADAAMSADRFADTISALHDQAWQYFPDLKGKALSTILETLQKRMSGVDELRTIVHLSGELLTNAGVDETTAYIGRGSRRVLGLNERVALLIARIGDATVEQIRPEARDTYRAWIEDRIVELFPDAAAQLEQGVSVDAVLPIVAGERAQMRKEIEDAKQVAQQIDAVMNQEFSAYLQDNGGNVPNTYDPVSTLRRIAFGMKQKDDFIEGLVRDLNDPEFGLRVILRTLHQVAGGAPTDDVKLMRDQVGERLSFANSIDQAFRAYLPLTMNDVDGDHRAALVKYIDQSRAAFAQLNEIDDLLKTVATTKNFDTRPAKLWHILTLLDQAREERDDLSRKLRRAVNG